MTSCYRNYNCDSANFQLNLDVWKTQKSGTRTRKINECFKYGNMIDINPTPPFSAFLPRSPFKKRYKYKELTTYHSFQLNWVSDDALIIQNIFAFVCRSRQTTRELVEMWVCENLTLLCLTFNLSWCLHGNSRFCVFQELCSAFLYSYVYNNRRVHFSSAKICTRSFWTKKT